MWKGVLWRADLLRKGLQWRVCNGRSVEFWSDNWLERRPLSEESRSPVCVEGLGQTMCYYWDSHTGRAWGSFAQYLPASTLIKLAPMGLETKSLNKDLFVWGEGKEQFSVRAAYRLPKNWRGDEVWEG